jgi:hypothetical protein
MRHLRMVGLCMVAVFAIAAVAATSASALPEFGECYVQAKHEGKYANAGCTVKAKKVSEKFTGEYEWRKVTEIADKEIAGESGPGVLKANLLICPGNIRAEKCAEPAEVHVYVECSHQWNYGQITGAKTVGKVTVLFEGCTLLGSAPCTNTGVEGRIAVNPLKGTLGWINKSATPRQVGLVLEPMVKGEFAHFICSGAGETHVGVAKESESPAYPPKGGGDGIISPVTPVNTMSKGFTQTYAVSATEENIPSKFEGTAPLKVLETWLGKPEEPEFGSKWSKAGEELTNVEYDCIPEAIKGECAENSNFKGGEGSKPGEIKAN